MIERQVQNYSTPNEQNSRALLGSVGYDPLNDWRTMRAPGPRRAGAYDQQLQGWLQVRNAIAHGDANLPDSDVLEHVRQFKAKQRTAGTGTAVPPADPGLRLRDGVACVAFLVRLTRVTGDGFARSQGIQPVRWT